ncbi:uncharacterized protein LOC121257859 [Juglans microcarpa x Juglans regia]|uniref:uncharacterized protein LOC121257859 n=1 Tax=Juglans microcarpa x Juglans regia TaxID=2249226 RepID=UPI001B7EDFE6|nr:uncharacterized protein LOC121257859 [Juglans microcarpa x Juglans regia]
MHPTKALGSDSMFVVFFRSYCHIVEDSITAAVLDSLNNDGRNGEIVDEEQIVDNLIDATTKTWNAQLVRALFNPNIVVAILRIRLLQTQDVMEKHLCRCKIDILPTLTNLKRKKIVVKTQCGFCHVYEEDISHAMLTCSSNYSLWQKFLPMLQNFQSSLTFIDTVRMVMMQGSEAKLTMFSILCWSLWYRRNQLQMGNNLIQHVQAAKHALSICKTFNDVQITTTKDLLKVSKWQAPPDGYLKINVNGTIFANLRKAGVGIVLWDMSGRIVIAASKNEDEVDEAAIIESIAILRGLQLCLPLGIPNFVIKCDCLNVVHELQSTEESFASAGNLINEPKNLMRRFQQVRVQHTTG